MGPREFLITPERWLPRGEALVRGHRKNLVLWNAIPGEEAVGIVYHEGEHQDLGRVLRPAGRAHPARREPPCDRFNPCGGCPIMHVGPEAQARVRLYLLREALTEHGLAELLPASIAASPDGAQDFRHMIKLAVGLSDQGHLRVGASGRDHGHVIPIPECLVVTEPIRKAMQLLAFHVRDLKLYPYEPEQDRGLLRHVILRQSRATGELLVTLVAARRLALLWELAERLAAGLSAVAGVHLHVNDGPGNAIFQRDSQVLGETMRCGGRDYIEDALAGVRLRVGPSDFFPTNPGMADLIVRDIVLAFAEDGERPAVDLYCGVGATTLALAAAPRWAFGVELFDGAVERARENAALNHVSAEFAAGDVATVLPELGRRLKGASPVVAVDLGRTGLAGVVASAILDLRPARLVLRSCNPRTLARDLADFQSAGWSVDWLKAYDSFPQTAHVELLARLSPPGAPEPARRSPRRKMVRA